MEIAIIIGIVIAIVAVIYITTKQNLKNDPNKAKK
jgi:hypothetical protein